jgi:hypothetical protein
MLTYGGMEEGETLLIIPNNVVRELMSAILLDIHGVDMKVCEECE